MKRILPFFALIVGSLLIIKGLLPHRYKSPFSVAEFATLPALKGGAPQTDGQHRAKLSRSTKGKTEFSHGFRREEICHRVAHGRHYEARGGGHLSGL